MIVLVLTAYDDTPYIRALFGAGADGYVLKTARANELVESVRNVHKGLAAPSPAVATKAVLQATGPRAPGASDHIVANVLTFPLRCRDRVPMLAIP